MSLRTIPRAIIKSKVSSVDELWALRAFDLVGRRGRRRQGQIRVQQSEFQGSLFEARIGAGFRHANQAECDEEEPSLDRRQRRLEETVGRSAQNGKVKVIGEEEEREPMGDEEGENEPGAGGGGEGGGVAERRFGSRLQRPAEM